MSLLWRDRLQVHFAPQQLRLQRQASAWNRSRGQIEATVDCPDGGDDAAEEPAWASPLSALRRELLLPRWAGCEVILILSSHFVRYLTIPWDEQLVTEEEQGAMVRHAFVQAHGAGAENWTFRWDVPPAPAPCLASAVDTPLLAGLREACAEASLPLVSVQPQLMRTLNAHRGELPTRGDFWLLGEEAGRICLAWIHAAAPAALYSQRVAADWLEELPELLVRGMLLAGSGAAPGAVYLHLTSPQEVAAELPAGWSLHLLRQTDAGMV